MKIQFQTHPIRNSILITLNPIFLLNNRLLYSKTTSQVRVLLRVLLLFEALQLVLMNLKLKYFIADKIFQMS